MVRHGTTWYEMVIKGCHLIHLSRRELQQIRQRRKVGRGKMFISVLDPVQALNKMVALQCYAVDGGAHFSLGGRIYCATLTGAFSPNSLVARLFHILKMD